MHRLAKPIVLSVGDQAGSWKRKFKSGKKIQVSVDLERKPPASPAGELRDDIGKVSRARRGRAIPDTARKHISGLAEGAKFESERGGIIEPAADAGFGATRRRRSGKPQKGDSGSPGEPEAGHTEDAGGEETRNRIGRVDGAKDGPGNLRVHFIETPETTVSGVSI